MRVYHNFFWYPDPDKRFLMRIRIRPNDTDPDPKHWLKQRTVPLETSRRSQDPSGTRSSSALGSHYKPIKKMAGIQT